MRGLLLHKFLFSFYLSPSQTESTFLHIIGNRFIIMDRQCLRVFIFAPVYIITLRVIKLLKRQGRRLGLR